MLRRIAITAVVALAVAGLAVPAAGASKNMLIGFNDDANALFGDQNTLFPLYQELHTQVLRVNLDWGGTPYAVANAKPANGADPGDPAYNWAAYDRLVRYSSQYGIKVVFSIVFTPRWANGGRARYFAPKTNAGWIAMRKFATAAAIRYSGTYTPPVYQQDPNNSTSALPLPAVRFWTAWNEPNNPVFLRPQWQRIKRKAVDVSARTYVKICNAIYTGVHSTLIRGEKVACGVTAPRGNNMVNSVRSSTSPLAFMGALKKFGLKKFDAYAHHPYYGSRFEKPNSKPRARTAVELGNIGTLITQLTRYWGRKPLWITEYGYQTNPASARGYGVTLKQQAAYLKQAFAIARKNPRITMMLWFLLRDDPHGWRSGLLTPTGAHKPAFNAFLTLPR